MQALVNSICAWEELEKKEVIVGGIIQAAEHISIHCQDDLHRKPLEEAERLIRQALKAGGVPLLRGYPSPDFDSILKWRKNRATDVEATAELVCAILSQGFWGWGRKIVLPNKILCRILIKHLRGFELWGDFEVGMEEYQETGDIYKMVKTLDDSGGKTPQASSQKKD